jgi:hypothetical protein
MKSDQPREMSIKEVDRLPMEVIEKITARSPLKDYRTPNQSDGTFSHVVVFWNGGRFAVIYDGNGKPFDYQAEGVRFEALGDLITVMASETSSARRA